MTRARTLTLYRPVGPAELELIAASGWTAFPPRLPEQPIFYPVLNERYAAQIAEQWNATDSGAGYVTAFEVDAEYLARFEVRQVGGREHLELWVPAEDLATFNEHIVGAIRVVRTFEAESRGAAVRAAVRASVDESIEVVDYDLRWPTWYAADAAELAAALGAWLAAIDHFGSTAVPGLAAKPIIDVLVAPLTWPLADRERRALEALGYEYHGDAGVAGRDYFRRRSGHATNIAAVERDGVLWRENLLLRDYLRAHSSAAERYARVKRAAWEGGARTLLAYSDAKADHVAALLARAKAWRGGAR